MPSGLNDFFNFFLPGIAQKDTPAGKRWVTHEGKHLLIDKNGGYSPDETFTGRGNTGSDSKPSSHSTGKPEWMAQNEQGEKKISALRARNAARGTASPKTESSSGDEAKRRETYEALTKPHTSIEDVKKYGGWKLHLATDSAEEASRILQEMGLKHKVGRSGQEGKDITIYVGHRDAADIAAKDIQKRLGRLLKKPHGDTLKDDIPMTPLVMARFDAPTSDNQFHQYGRDGIPYTKDDMESIGTPYGNAKDEAARQAAVKRAQAILTKRYGSYFTGSNR